MKNFESTKDRKNSKDGVRYNSRRYVIRTNLDKSEMNLVSEFCKEHKLSISDFLRCCIKTRVTE